jgi:hypothetical protein
MSELLPCPFCGGDKLKLRLLGDQRAYVCQDCEAQGPKSLESGSIPYSGEFPLAWNRRASQAEIERLKAALTVCLEAVNKAGGTALGVAMSGKNHPNPDGALMGVFQACQEASAKGAAALSGSKE